MEELLVCGKCIDFMCRLLEARIQTNDVVYTEAWSIKATSIRTLALISDDELVYSVGVSYTGLNSNRDRRKFCGCDKIRAVALIDKVRSLYGNVKFNGFTFL
jgi:hypothetical protein